MNFLNRAICQGLLGLTICGELVVYNDMDVLDNGDVILMGQTVDGGVRMHCSLEIFLEDNPCYREVIA